MQIQTALFSTSTETDNGLLVRALVLYEGEFQPMQGKPIKFSPARIKKIAAESNKHLGSGIQTAIFAGGKDHAYSQDSKVGLIEGPYEAKIITAEDLPDPNLTDLIGKLGLFTKVRLTKDQAIADFKAKILRPISAGIDLMGKTYSKFADAIFEISGVSFSAVPGAALFSGGSYPQDALAQFAHANFNDRLVRQETFDELYRIQAAFTDTYREILEEEPTELDQPKDALLSQLITDYAQALSDRLLSVPPSLPPATLPPPQIQLSINPDDEEDEDMADQAQLAALQARIDHFEQRDKVATLYARVSTKAQALFAAQKITPKQLEDILAGNGTTDEAIAKFSAEQKDPAETVAALEKLEVELTGAEKYAQPIVNFGSLVGSQPLPAGPGAASPEQIEKEAQELVAFSMGLPRIY